MRKNKKKELKRGFLNIPFSWLFAIIAGMFILFLAIYVSTKIIGVGQYSLDTKTAKQIGVLLNPLETGFETGKSTHLTLPAETKFLNECSISGSFGKQKISISQKSFNKWPEPAAPVSFSNKYIFSDEIVEGKKFYIFLKPFEFPFKVSDLTYLTSADDNYCFKNPPEEIEMEISDLNQENLRVENVGQGCPENSIDVCFSSSNCDINVYPNQQRKYVKKQGETMYYEGDALMYAAIFSDPIIYECQLKRLMQRTKSLAQIYKEKAALVSQKNCNSNLNLMGLISAVDLDNFEDSGNLILTNNLVEDIKEKNNNAICKLW